MAYLVRLTGRALRDLDAIYEFIEADTSGRAHLWFNDLAEAIYSLERFPMRGAVANESKSFDSCFLE
jgi:plasmid stabilization system protein ParE